MRAFYLLPMIGTGDRLNPRRCKYICEMEQTHTGRILLNRDLALASVVGEPEQLLSLSKESDVFFLSEEAMIEFPSKYDDLYLYLKKNGIYAEWLTPGLSSREVIYKLGNLALFPKRFSYFTKETLHPAMMDKPWRKLKNNIKDAFVHTVEDLGYRVKSIEQECQFSEFFKFVSGFYPTLFIGGYAVHKPMLRDATMVYGDRSEVTSDTFDASIDSDWTNGPFSWNALTWFAGGFVGPNASSDTMMFDEVNTFDDDQYATATAETINSGGWIWASVRNVGGASFDEACYLFTIDNGSSDDYHLYEITNGPSFNLIETIINPTFGTGDTITCECEGTTIRGGSNEGGGDTQRDDGTNTDPTLTTGFPGIGGIDEAANDMEITSVSMGDITAATNPEPGAGPLVITTNAVSLETGINVPTGPIR